MSAKTTDPTKGETIAGGADDKCTECGAALPLGVCSSAAGYYVGTWCDTCGPYSRESGYYKTRDEAERALASGDFGRMPGFNGRAW